MKDEKIYRQAIIRDDLIDEFDKKYCQNCTNFKNCKAIRGLLGTAYKDCVVEFMMQKYNIGAEEK